MSELQLRNRQGVRSIDLRALRRWIRRWLGELRPEGDFELGVYLVAEAEMIRLNETYLHHAGPTDVIAFDYAEGRAGGRLHGEVFVCVEEAVRQARRYRTSLPREVARYVLHGLLHLHGHEDARPAARRRMKQVEDRLLRRATAPWAGPARPRRAPARRLAGAPA